MTPDHEGSSSPACNSLNDRTSIFKYDEDEGEGEEWAVVNLTQLLEIVDEHFRQPCKLVKLAEGGYHKIYDIHPCHEGTRTLDAVLRVASPAFPSDKMNSEVATLRYIGEHSSVPVPKVYAWNADAGSPAGVEYMIMEKVPGVAPLDIWPDLPVDIKEKVVVQVAEHLVALFHLRFSQAGSIYLSDPASSSSESVLSPTADTYRIGPVITGPFYRALNRILERPDSDLIVPNTPPPYNSLHSLRGPFAHASEYLSSYLRAKLLKLSVCRAETLASLNLDGNDADSEKGELILQQAEKVLKKAIELCHVYPGDVPVPGDISTPDRPFTVKFDDFRLVNILVCLPLPLVKTQLSV
ncbi:hypothetical protein FIBSPDRAFT_767061 [Athelia psychrophila]|uniref:Altered inheritance of mitochondria protein 9, mitochondrial n=1 Tax=Athelia psychrophila TaxID=1759441 RepID=A0A167V4T8_9AGAM|nr:hypothetical protein FIBSPDRAFT_767061 [Fibularhizoctonia sp. CBS 109695]